MSTSSTTYVISPEGQFGTVPSDNLEAAKGKGFQQAMRVTSPEGQEGIIPVDNWAQAQAKGFKAHNDVADLANQALAQNPKSAGIKVAPTQVATTQPKPQGLVKTLWNAANTPIADLATDPNAPRTADVITGALADKLMPGMGPIIATPEGRQQMVDQAVASGNPTKAAITAGVTGALQSTGEALAPFTSPLSIATAAAGPASKIPGLLGRVARIGTTAAGVGFGTQGAVNAGEAATGTGDFATATPEQRIQGGLQGASQALMGATALHGVPQAAEDSVALVKQANQGIQSVLPNAIARRVIPEALQTPDTIATGAARQAAKQGNNLSAALDQGGNAPRGVMTHEDVAQPVLDDIRAEAARQGVTADNFKGRDGYIAGKKLTEGVRKQYDDAYNALIDPIRDEPASAAAKAASDEVVNKMLSDSSLLDEIKRGTPDGTNVQQLQNIAGSIRNSRTVGELDTARQALNRLASAFEGKSEGQQYVSPLVQKSMSEGAGAIRNALYNDIAQRYGGMTVNGESVGVPADEIRDLQRAHGAAIQADQMMGDTARNLSSVASAESAKPSAKNFIARLGYRATMGSKSHAAAGVMEKLFGGSDLDLFNTRMKRVISGASPDEGRAFPTPPITPEYVDSREVPDMRTSPVQPRLPAPPPDAQVVPPTQPQLPPFIKGELPPASRIYGTPEETAQQVDVTSGPPSRSVTPLGPTGKGGVLVRRLGLLSGATEAPLEATPPAAPVEPSQPRGGLPFLRPKAASTPESTTAVASAETQGAEPTTPRTLEVSESSPEGYTGPERRANTDFRQQVAQMTPEQKDQALLEFHHRERTNPRTGLPNRLAFDEAQQKAPAPAIAMSDADGLKALNDTFGYEAGNAMLQAKADALQQADVEAYHTQGDEFLARSNSKDELLSRLEKAREILRNRVFEATLPDGTVRHFTGADFSHGIGQDIQEAETGLKANKSAREAAGERTRGALRGITEVTQGNEDPAVTKPNAGQQTDAVTPTTAAPAPPATTSASQQPVKTARREPSKPAVRKRSAIPAVEAATPKKATAQVQATPSLKYTPAVEQGLKAWAEGRAYIDNAGNYHEYISDPASPRGKKRGPISTWNKDVKAAFSSVDDLHKAAQAYKAPSKPAPKQAPELTKREGVEDQPIAADAQQLTPNGDVADGRKFEGRYLRAALEPAKAAWESHEGKGKPNGLESDRLAVQVPDDGRFTIPNTPKAIARAIKASDNFTQPSAPRYSRSAPRPPAEFDSEAYIASLKKEISNLEDGKDEYGQPIPDFSRRQELLRVARENMLAAQSAAVRTAPNLPPFLRRQK